MIPAHAIAFDRLLEVATRATDAAGSHALQNKHRCGETTGTFSHDVKLVLDVECQKIAEETILSEFPDHGILGEEDVKERPDESYEWIIDPIDGTMNYSYGFPYWCCSIAVRHNKKILAGCVYAPEFGDFYTAHLEAPAKRNGEPIRVSNTPQLQESLIFTGLSKDFESTSEIHFEMFRKLALNTRKLRINGAAALDLCHVAAGTTDGFFETGIYVWDYAAAGLIAERAGAVLSLYPYKNELHRYSVLCANNKLISGLQAIHQTTLTHG